MKAFARFLSVLSLTAICVACGGGGTSAPTPPPPTVPVNQAPTAYAAVERRPGVETCRETLTARGSADADGVIASYAWSQTGGTAVNLQDPTSVSPWFATPPRDVQHVLTFVVTVTDDDGATDSASIDVTLVPWYVDAGPDREAVERERVPVGASTNHGDVVGSQWVQTAGPAGTFEYPKGGGSPTEGPDFVAPIVAAVTDVELQVTFEGICEVVGTDSFTVTVNPNEPPELTLHFPCTDCRFFDDTVSVTGHVTSGTDNAYVSSVDGISDVSVDAGVIAIGAVVQNDGTWVAQNVPMPTTSSALSISVTAIDLFGESSNAMIDLSYQPTITSALVAHDPITPDVLYLFETENPVERLLSVDLNAGSFTEIYSAAGPTASLGQAFNAVVQADGSRLLVSEALDGIVAIDLNTGATSVVSDAVTGNGLVITNPRLMGLDSNDNRLAVYDDNLKALFLVDVATGDRLLISDNAGTGNGPGFGNPQSIVVDSANDIAYLHEAGTTFLSVDFTTGDRTTLAVSGDNIPAVSWMDADPMRSGFTALNQTDDQVFAVTTPGGVRTQVSDEAPGSAVAAANARQITTDVLGDRYVINDYSSNLMSLDTDRLLSVDPTTGNRSVLYEDALGSGPSVNGSATLDIDLGNNALHMASATEDNIISLNLATGVRQVVSDATTGTGTAFDTIRDIGLDTDANRALVVDAGIASILEVDLTSGNRSVVSGGIVGGGPAFSTPVALEADLANDRVFVLDQGLQAVVTVDLSTGQRTLLSSGANSGPALMEAHGLALDAANDRLLVTELGAGGTVDAQLLAVDLATGDRTVVSSFLIGLGPFLDSLRDVILLGDPDFAVVSSTVAYYLVDLRSGDRLILADSATANGESVINSPSMAYDSSIDVFYTWSTNFDAVFAFDAFTGDRVVVTK